MTLMTFIVLSIKEEKPSHCPYNADSMWHRLGFDTCQYMSEKYEDVRKENQELDSWATSKGLSHISLNIMHS